MRLAGRTLFITSGSGACCPPSTPAAASANRERSPGRVHPCAPSTGRSGVELPLPGVPEYRAATAAGGRAQGGVPDRLAGATAAAERYRRFSARNLPLNKMCMAIALELSAVDASENAAQLSCVAATGEVSAIGASATIRDDA